MLIHPNPDPVAFAIGPLSVHWYGLMYMVAFAQFIVLGRYRFRLPHVAAKGWTREHIDDMLFYGVLGVILGGRLGEVLFTDCPTTSTIRWKFSKSGKAACHFMAGFSVC
jgi:phosphatidylglycerol:prolipoprotein diacylglycerol transferase